MRKRLAAFSAAALMVACAASCSVLAHPVSNDGNDASNPNGANPGTMSLTINASRSSLGVGDTASIIGTIGGQTVVNNGLFTSTSSDPSVLWVAGTFMWARSVGTVTINAVYSGYQATQPMTVSVHPAVNGSSASVIVQNTDPPVFAPNNVYIKAGSVVQFSVGTAHNVVFDVLAGVPQNVQTGAGTVLRTFPVVGMFSYQCTAHGETGVVNVIP
jgi:plastocyanin